MLDRIDLNTGKELFIFLVWANPKPDDICTTKNPDRSPIDVNSNRVDRQRGMNFLEPKRRVIWIRRPQPVRGICFRTDELGRFIEKLSKLSRGMGQHALERLGATCGVIGQCLLGELGQCVLGFRK